MVFNEINSLEELSNCQIMLHSVASFMSPLEIRRYRKTSSAQGYNMVKLRIGWLLNDKPAQITPCGHADPVSQLSRSDATNIVMALRMPIDIASQFDKQIFLLTEAIIIYLALLTKVLILRDFADILLTLRSQPKFAQGLFSMAITTHFHSLIIS